MESQTQLPQSLTPVQDQDENLRQWKHHQGLDGIPFRTREDTVPMYKKDDAAHRQPKQVADMHIRQFNLREEKERLEVETILDLCAKGRGYVSQLQVEFDSTVKGWRVFLIWGEFFLEDPVEADRANLSRNTQSFS